MTSPLNLLKLNKGRRAFFNRAPARSLTGALDFMTRKTKITIGKLRQEFKKIKSIVDDDTWFVAQAMMFLCENLKPALLRKKRQPSQWQRFLGEQMKAGKSIKEAALLWKSQKR